jgi:hypothetical protein
VVCGSLASVPGLRPGSAVRVPGADGRM